MNIYLSFSVLPFRFSQRNLINFFFHSFFLTLSISLFLFIDDDSIFRSRNQKFITIPVSKKLISVQFSHWTTCWNITKSTQSTMKVQSHGNFNSTPVSFWAFDLIAHFQCVSHSIRKLIVSSFSWCQFLNISVIKSIFRHSIGYGRNLMGGN